jgi:hypothetical protein
MNRLNLKRRQENQEKNTGQGLPDAEIFSTITIVQCI